MKFSATLTLAAAGSLAAAQAGHRRVHRHHHKRDVATATTVVDEVVTVYQLDGTPVPVADVCKGIKDGDYKWAVGKGPDVCESSTSATVKPHEFLETPTSTPVPTTTSTTPTSTAVPTTSSAPPTTTSTSTTSTSTSTSTSTTSTSTSTSAPAPSSTAASTSSYSGGTGVTASFPDGELSCDTFPSDYGAVALDYFNIGGWSGIQYPTMNSLGTLVDSIVTAVSGQSCTEGAMCSYQCPPGYLKSQWPSTQGSTGQSVGGVTCKGGKLHRTNSDHETLCIAGVQGVTVENQLGQTVSVCRTDYPGTESETLPLELAVGSAEQLANPDQSSYFYWEGKPTTAQYYINPAGFTADKACTWGSSSDDNTGNWAPMNMGVGYSDGVTYLSIFPNEPTTDAKLKYNVKFEGDVSPPCYYDASSATYYKDGVPNTSEGCTVGIPQGGSAKVVFH